MAREATCRLLPTRPQFTAASLGRPDIINRPPHRPSIQEREHADLRLHDALRRLRTVCGYLPVRHYAHRYHLPPGLQHRAQYVLGVLLLREGLSAVCD